MVERSSIPAPGGVAERRAHGSDVVGRPVERRRSPRVARRGRLTIFVCRAGGLGDGVRADFRDASARGIGLEMWEPLGPGEQFMVRLSGAGGAPVSMLYTVIRCARHAGHPFVIGAELACVMRGADTR